jgi:hypothetical protein
MISINIVNKYPDIQVDLKFSHQMEWTASLGDVNEIQENNPWTNPTPFSTMGGTYFIDGANLSQASKICIDNQGTPVPISASDLYMGNFYASNANQSFQYVSRFPSTPPELWNVVDEFGYVANFDPVTGFISNVKTIEEVKLPGSFQVMRWHDSGIVMSYGAAYTDNSVDLDSSSIISPTPYMTGHMTGSGGQGRIINLSTIGNIKEFYSAATIDGYLSQGAWLGYDVLGDPGTFDVDNDLPSGFLGTERQHIQMKYIPGTELTQCTMFDVGWYIQYAAEYLFPGASIHRYFNSSAYPLKEILSPNTYSANLYYHAHQSHEDSLDWDEYQMKPLLKSSTPNSTGGDDNGDASAGWYKPHDEGNEVWHYFNGIKWTRSAICYLP